MRLPPPTSSMPVSYGSTGGDVMVASMWRSAIPRRSIPLDVRCRVGQVGRVGDIDLGDVPGKVTLVVGDEPVGTGADGGGQVGRVGGLQPVSGRQGRGELGGRQVDRAQVKPGQEPGEDPDLVCRAVAQWPAEYFGEQQDRAGAGWGGGARAA